MQIKKDKDGYICLKCNMREDDSLKIFNHRLAVHHIDYIRANTFEQNCCALCMRCNAEVNVDRKHWKKFFQSLLNERHGYEYGHDGSIILNMAKGSYKKENNNGMV